jgi:hypothetical protein
MYTPSVATLSNNKGGKKMIVCKNRLYTLQLTQGNSYRKADIFPGIDNPEFQQSIFFDPVCGELYSFHKEDSDDYLNVFNSGVFTISGRTGAPLQKPPAWIRTKIRHVFLHRTGQPDASYEYLGTALDETAVRGAAGGIVSASFAVR